MAEKDKGRKGILGDFSLSQLIATGLAAATSFALSAKIGIAGSIIGSVLGAVVSSVATQVYRNILSTTGEKIGELAPDVTVRRSHEEGDSGEGEKDETGSASGAATADAARSADLTQLVGAAGAR